MTKINQQIIIQSGKDLIVAGKQPSFSAIGRCLDVHSQALYPYFRNQDDLKAAIVNDLLAQVVKQHQNYSEGQAELRARIIALRNQALEHPHLTRFVINELQNEPSMVAQKSLVDLRETLHRLLEASYQHPQIRLLASRTLRCLLIGDIYNNINGWFTNNLSTPNESFSTMLDGTMQWLNQMEMRVGKN
jgi:AcrR family transcriptional regulator